MPASIAAHATAELVVDERVDERRQTDWFSPVADAAIKAYLADRRVRPRRRRRACRPPGSREPRSSPRPPSATSCSRRRTRCRPSTEETRRNLRAIEKNKTAESLRQKLTARLADAATKLDDYNRKIVELDSKLSELTVQFKEAIRDVKVLPSAAG